MASISIREITNAYKTSVYKTKKERKLERPQR
jgi:hypothetical protein